MSDPPRRAFGRYEVLRRLGEGGFGEVHLARDPVLDRTVAVKVPRARFWADDSVLEEARALARLRHPAIVAVLDAGRHDGIAYIVLEHLDGRGLAEELGRRAGPFDPREALVLVSEAADALDHAHARGVLHLDVKPENLVVPRVARGAPLPPARVLDFGLGALAARHDQGGGGQPGGDPRYQPVEAWRGRRDEAADVHALAAVYFELVTRRPPIPGDGPAEQIQAAKDGRRLRLREVRPGAPAALDAALAAALSPRRHDRPRTARALVRSIEDALARDGEERRLVADARDRIRARERNAPDACPECGTPLNPRARACPSCLHPT